MEILQIIVILFVLFAISRAWLRFKEGKIKPLEFLFWLIVWISTIIAFVSPSTIGYISRLFGIGRPADLVIYVAVILLFYLVFRIYVSLDGIEEKITKITSETAIRKAKTKKK